MRRTPLKRGTSQLKRTGSLPPMSRKRIAEIPVRAAVRAETFARQGGVCAARDLVPEVRCWHPDGPGVLDCDEIKGRGVNPGGHLDPTNTQGLCRAHHDWRGAYPDEARARGLRKRSTDD